MDTCPNCSLRLHVETSTISIVKVKSLYCPVCETQNYSSSLIRPFSRPDMVYELDRLRCKHTFNAVPYIVAAMTYLQEQVDKTSLMVAPACAANKKRRLDLWERQFIKDATRY